MGMILRVAIQVFLVSNATKIIRTFKGIMATIVGKRARCMVQRPTMMANNRATRSIVMVLLLKAVTWHLLVMNVTPYIHIGKAIG